MADPRSTNTRRAVLSYDQLKKLTGDAGTVWPDLLIKDYQGIIQDFNFLADEADKLELRIAINEVDIADLQLRVEALEYRVFETIFTSVSLTTEEFQTIICNNTSSINITLKTSPLRDDEVNIKRSESKITVIGLIDGKQNKVINVKGYSMHLVFNGVEWSEI